VSSLETSWNEMGREKRAAAMSIGPTMRETAGDGTGAAVCRQTLRPAELEALLDLSGRVGRNPLLVQGSTGNTSVKIGGTLWVKASGKWLANAGRETILVAVDIAECRERFARGDYFPSHRESSCSNRLHPSIETFLHAVLPHRVIVHVHSVNAIAWAVCEDAEAQLQPRLYGLRWRWVPYAASGRPLARRIRAAFRKRPDPNVFVLGNHGLVVCGDDCEQVEDLLCEVERRLAAPARVVPQANRVALEKVRSISGWRLPDDPAIHTLGTDRHSRRILQNGVLYPCQAMFLGTGAHTVPLQEPPSVMRRRIARIRQTSPFLIVERCGVLVSEDMSAAEDAALRGYVAVVRRVPTSATIRYLSKAEVRTAVRHGLH
jgi:rhamnose utilization protein RhaD (predicted bifunctional aldolase and dehydrogenase)